MKRAILIMKREVDFDQKKSAVVYCSLHFSSRLLGGLNYVIYKTIHSPFKQINNEPRNIKNFDKKLKKSKTVEYSDWIWLRSNIL